MRGRKLRSGSLVALVGALILVLGSAPSLAQRKPAHIYDTIPDKDKRDYPHRANRVTVRFKKALVEEGTEGKNTTIVVEDACGRTLSGATTRAPAPEGQEWVEKASVELDRRTKNPRGVYSVFVSYWLASDGDENPEDPGEDDPPAQEARTYEYSFHVHGGPNCDGSPRPGHGGGHGGGDGNDNKNRVWGNTSGSGHDSDGGHTGHENLRSATGSSTDHTTDHTTDFSPFTSPTFPSSDHSSTHTGSTTPFGEDDFGDPFGDTTGTSPLSDPTDPSLYDSEPGQIPEEAEDQTLSAAPADDLEPEPSTLVVALATALLLGVGGGLFLRRTDPAPIRS